MAETVLDQVVEVLRTSGANFFPQRSELKAVRVVGHTPKAEHYTYEIVMEFTDGGERASVKVYRASKCGAQAAHDLARREFHNLNFAYQALRLRKPSGVPRPIGDFTSSGAVVSTKIGGLPLQSLMMKAALLPDFGNHGLLERAAAQAGRWLKQFHEATEQIPASLDSKALLAQFEKLCSKAKRDGLPHNSTEAILDHARTTLTRLKEPVSCSAVLNGFAPLNVMVAEDGVGFCEFAQLTEKGNSLNDAAMFLASVEALEKYPFCDHAMTSLVQDAFLDAYDLNLQDAPLLTVLKLKVLLQMFINGRTIKESAERKKVMWTNVMKRFIQQAAERSISPAA